MSRLWRAATSPSNEDVAHQILMKNSLTQGLANAVKRLQVENVMSDEPITSNDTVNSVCSYLEAIFLHGIKDSLSDRFNSLFSSNPDKVPHPHFWGFVSVFSHKDVVCQINLLSQISSDVGRCRAWVRIAMNDGLIESYIKTMSKDLKTLKIYYKPYAYLRDAEQPDILASIIEGLGVFSFKLPFNSRILNAWTSKPLLLCGLWTPAMVPDPVMPAVDVAQYFEGESNESEVQNEDTTSATDNLVYEEKIATRPRSSAITSYDLMTDGVIIDSSDLPTRQDYDVKLDCILNSDGALSHNPTETSDDLSSDDRDSVPCVSRSSETWINIQPTVIQARYCESPVDLYGMSPSVGNSLSIKSGWSSPFDFNESERYGIRITESFDTLLSNYNQSRKQAIVIGTPSSHDLIMVCGDDSSSSSSPPNGTSKNESDSNSTTGSRPKASSPVSLEGMEFEVVPSNYIITSSHANSRTQTLLSVIDEISNEKGLDFQNYECNNCKRPIGMIYGKARVCHYDGFYYCFECHENESSVIPARILHNWDFNKYHACKLCKSFLTQVDDEPLIDVRKINSQLYSIVDELNAIQLLRTQLSYLRSYLFTCRESVAEDLRKRVWPKEYLYEHIHLYALSDFTNVLNGSLAQSLQKVIHFGSKHVHQCRLCSQKGFICEVCDNSKVIYPFELNSTYRCESCLAVYHASCMDVNKTCPKCERRRMRKNTSDDFTMSD